MSDSAELAAHRFGHGPLLPENSDFQESSDPLNSSPDPLNSSPDNNGKVEYKKQRVELLKQHCITCIPFQLFQI